MEQNPCDQKHVLVVEDDPSAREAINLLLRIDRYTVTEVENGREAIELVCYQPFDLVILDYALPGMQGEEVALRIMCVAPAVPILMVTAYAEMLRPGDLPGVRAVLGKPFAPDELRGAVARLLC